MRLRAVDHDRASRGQWAGDEQAGRALRGAGGSGGHEVDIPSLPAIVIPDWSGIHRAVSGLLAGRAWILNKLRMTMGRRHARPDRVTDTVVPDSQHRGL